MPEVSAERSGWRDEALSRRHRRWGFDCPMVDLDFVGLEYDKGRATAIVECKNERAAPQYASSPSYQAMIDLGTRAGVAVFACRYTEDFASFTAVPLNDEAKKHLPKRKEMTEPEWVRFLYSLRGYDCPQSVIDGIYTEI